jgi:myosin heavy subunit
VEAPPEGLAVEQLAHILGISKEDFIRCLTMQKVSTSSRASVNVKYLSHQTARNNAFSMIKWLYRSMFSWIVRKINSVFGAVAIRYMLLIQLLKARINACTEFRLVC